MGFYLWLDRDVAWAQGSYEYRPMGAAVVAASDLFTNRDFDSARKVNLPPAARYLGQYASLGQVNGILQAHRPSRGRGARTTPACSVHMSGGRSFRERLLRQKPAGAQLKSAG
jgi:hypothetical protein